LSLRFCDELDWGFGWYDDDDKLRRTSHALAHDGGVWLLDPVASTEVEARALELGELRGVVQLLDRHDRDGADVARRLGVPHHRVPHAVDSAPFELLPIARLRFWREVALWLPERRTLVVGDALGTLPYFRARGEPVGVHPLLRVWPPRSLRRIFPEHLLCGHGRGIHENASHALHEALRTSRRRLPAALANAARR
jgi:hypothetical protein